MSLATMYGFVLGVVTASERQRDARKLYRIYADPAPVRPALLAATPLRAMIFAVEGTLVSLPLVLQELPCCRRCGFGLVSPSRIQRAAGSHSQALQMSLPNWENHSTPAKSTQA